MMCTFLDSSMEVRTNVTGLKYSVLTKRTGRKADRKWCCAADTGRSRDWLTCCSLYVKLSLEKYRVTARKQSVQGQ